MILKKEVNLIENENLIRKLNWASAGLTVAFFCRVSADDYVSTFKRVLEFKHPHFVARFICASVFNFYHP
ncbi:hypothetical protein MFLO_01120 [Listeria floridensis FSL S10-1187]|uniref:Uncharacterized protein n=1 Tax=Listeria floridensis FSL S10-1187 TaxID=1265817 RepID=A0ABP3B1J6_9LIST|nr:hypothetical protein MFLO_01120 [Listeria floridensis FSL S10-1187]